MNRTNQMSEIRMFGSRMFSVPEINFNGKWLGALFTRKMSHGLMTLNVFGQSGWRLKSFATIGTLPLAISCGRKSNVIHTSRLTICILYRPYPVYLWNTVNVWNPNVCIMVPFPNGSDTFFCLKLEIFLVRFSKPNVLFSESLL